MLDPPARGRGSPSAAASHVGLSKAERWYENTNNNASKDVPFSDNDPPFYMDQQPSSDGNSARAVHSDGSSLKHSTLGKPTAPTRSLLACMDSSESNSEGYRSVIDDLTVQNKKLRTKLKRYEKLHCSHLQEEKLFEVRIHGLASSRRRELEETLRRFAASIEDAPSEDLVLDSLPAGHTGHESRPQGDLQIIARDRYPSTESLLAVRKPSSSSTSCSKPIDSAYASMSGQAGNLQLQDRGRYDRLNQASQKQQNVKSYLHDIPETLVPKYSRPLSERMKSKLVVRRLEQIFTGKGEGLHHYTQSCQQQEISQSAAYADQIRLEAQGRGRRIVNEGIREARILPENADLQVDSLNDANVAAQQSQQSSFDARDSVRSLQTSRDQSPNQRPTRPLDLDLHRAQVPSDNIDYIRHLGLSSPVAPTNLNINDGWVYLNLLTSMAQVHTLNVTPGFIRRAIAKVSSRFELSADGTKVRWLGGKEGTRLSIDSDGSSDEENMSSVDDSLSASRCRSSAIVSDRAVQDFPEPGTLPMLSHDTLNNSGYDSKRQLIFLKHENNTTDFHYKPLFFHGLASKHDDSNTTIDSIASTDVMENATGMNSGVNSGSHGLRETEVRLRKYNAENGPIIFYHKARFCTDLSGDPSGVLMDENSYHRFSDDPIGCPPASSNMIEEGSRDGDFNAMETESMYARTIASTSDLDGLRSCPSDCLSLTNCTNPRPFLMEVSGLGGIQPDDNFVVNVQVRHLDRGGMPSLSLPKQAQRALNRLKHKNLSGSSVLRDSIQSQALQMPFSSEITSIDKIILQPSSLPPPSYVCLPFSSSEFEDDDTEGEGEGEGPDVPCNNDSQSCKGSESSASKPADLFAAAQSEEDIESSYLETSSGSDGDSSIDLLAHARVLDPDAIAARERDFENSMVPPGATTTPAFDDPKHYNPLQRVDSDMDSMSVSVNEDNGISMGDSD